MKLKIFFIINLLVTLCVAQQSINIIPRPVSLQQLSGNFNLSNGTALLYNPKQKELHKVAELFNQQIREITGYKLPVNSRRPTAIKIILEKIPNLGNEAYKMDVTLNGVVIKANTVAGIFYGTQSFLQTLPSSTSSTQLEIPCMSVTDFPRFNYRGMHLDVGRHFYPSSFVKKYIDFLATYKFNYFHWHLTEDQGWRIEIKKYPELIKKGAYRNGTIVGQYPGSHNTNLRYGGFYTQDEIKEIVTYAALRNITVVPEIELPGHSSAAIAAYPWLSCFPTDPSLMSTNASAKSKLVQSQGEIKMVQESWGVYDDIFCAGKDSTFIFLENVLDEVARLFPSKYIHIGGDEAPKKHWEKCPLCQARMKAEKLKDEHELQSYFIQRIEKYLNKKGKTIIGWDEILEGGLAPNAIVMSWRGEAGGIQAAKQHHNVIMTPGNPVYFDHYQGDPTSEPIAIGGFNNLKKVYEYDPIPKELNEQEAKYILGAQANLWTEYMPNSQHVEYMVLPRLLALSEVVWSPINIKDWNNFNVRLQSHYTSFEQKGWNYSRGNFIVDIKPEQRDGQLFVSLSTEAFNGKVIYTIDNSNPNINSKVYTELIPIKSSITLKASVLVGGKIMSTTPTQQYFTMHKSIGKDVQYLHPISRYYLGDGPNTLTDGIRGTNATNKYWHGINGKDLIANIDFGQAQSIQSITLGCLQKYGDWIFLPKSVKFESSLNGIDYEVIQLIENQISISEPYKQFDFKALFSEKMAKYIRVTAKNNLCPQGHSGDGQPGWIFADEIMVE